MAGCQQVAAVSKRLLHTAKEPGTINGVNFRNRPLSNRAGGQLIRTVAVVILNQIPYFGLRPAGLLVTWACLFATGP